MQTLSPSINRADSELPWYKHRWPWLLMAGPATVVVAGSITMWIAFTKQDAMVVDDYYKQGKAINQDLRRDKVASSLGMSFDARYDPASGELNGTLLGFGKPVAGNISIRLSHATQPEKDLQLLAVPDQNGDFSVNLPMLEMGRWDVLIEGEKRDWRLNGIWKWPQKKVLSLKADLTPAD